MFLKDLEALNLLAMQSDLNAKFLRRSVEFPIENHRGNSAHKIWDHLSMHRKHFVHIDD